MLQINALWGVDFPGLVVCLFTNSDTYQACVICLYVELGYATKFFNKNLINQV